jgi:hypothetical protein
MSKLSKFLRDTKAASAAEFALVLPVFLIFMVGIIDVGMYAWSINRAEKATQIGTRWAVVTELLPSGLASGPSSYSFATQGSPLITQGDQVPSSRFPPITCTGTGTGTGVGTATVTCTGTGEVPSAASATGLASFGRMIARMRQIDNRIVSRMVRVTYSWSGLGFAGDPNGPDVAPIVTVEINNPATADANKLKFAPITGVIFGATKNLPNLSYSLTSEDGSGNFSN